MLMRLMTAAAIAFAIPAAAEEAPCTDGAADQGCERDGTGDAAAREMDGGVPVGTADVSRNEGFVIEEPDAREARSRTERPAGDDILYWDGESPMVVPEESGPRLKIADW
jgi:hypothetical protein